jgi:iron(III) transport system substrate-binding protein
MFSLNLRIALVAGVCLLTNAHAQKAPAEPMSVEAIAAYQGPDRHERLLEGAKKESGLVVYHVYPALTKLVDAFGKKYDIKVKTWRAGSEAVLQRIINENKGNRHEVDMVQNNSPENEAASREKLLATVLSPYQNDLIAAAVPAHHQWVGITTDIFSMAYNTQKIKKEDLPKSYEDLLDPKWKGQLGIETNDQVWFGNLLLAMGEEKGENYFRTLVAKNQPSVRKGHSLLTMMVSSGEVPLALTVYSWNPEALKKKGAPVEGHAIAPLIAQVSTIGLLKKSPNPHTALLFYDFLISEGQQKLKDLLFVPTSKSIARPFPELELTYIDPGKALEMNAKWTQKFDEIVVKKSK